MAQGGGACNYIPDQNDRYVAAYSASTGAAMCSNWYTLEIFGPCANNIICLNINILKSSGSCFAVTGPKGSVVVRIVDYCDTVAGVCTEGFFTLDKVCGVIVKNVSIGISHNTNPCSNLCTPVSHSPVDSLHSHRGFHHHWFSGYYIFPSGMSYFETCRVQLWAVWQSKVGPHLYSRLMFDTHRC